MYGFGKSFVSLLKIPFTLTLKGDAFDHGELLGPLLLVFIPLGISCRFAREVNLKKVLICLVISIIYLIVWFFGSQQARFVLPILPVLCLLVAIGLDTVMLSSFKIVRVSAKLILVFFIIFSLCISLFFSKKFIKVVVGLETKETFLLKTIWGYPCIVWMNQKNR